MLRALCMICNWNIFDSRAGEIYVCYMRGFGLLQAMTRQKDNLLAQLPAFRQKVNSALEYALCNKFI